jgi:hypothetical protein
MTRASAPPSPRTRPLGRLFLPDRLRTGLRFRPLRPRLREGGAVVVPPGEEEPTNKYRQSRKCLPVIKLRKRPRSYVAHILSAMTDRFTPMGEASAWGRYRGALGPAAASRRPGA